METPFFGGFEVGRASNAANDQLINLFPQIVDQDGGHGKKIGAFYMTPGLDLLGTIGAGPIRGTHVMAGALYVVSGSAVYKVSSFNPFLAAQIGSIGSQSGPVSMIDNGTQIAIFDGNITNSMSASVVAGGSGGNNGTYALPFSAPNLSGGSQAAGTFTISGGTVTATSITTPGAGYNQQITFNNAQLAAVAGVGALTGASITVAVNGTAYLVGSTYTVTGVTPASPGGAKNQNYAPGDTIVLDLGSGSVPVVTVNNTAGANPAAWSITAGGATAVTGQVAVQGTTGTGPAKFNALLNCNGTTATSIISIGGGGNLSGSYTANPSNLAAEPVVSAPPGQLTGCTLSIVMGVLFVSLTSGATVVQQPQNPVAQRSSSGQGTGATFNVTYTINAQSVTAITVPFAGAVSAAYQDGFGVVNEKGTQFWWQSNLRDLSTWDPLNFTTADAQPDNVVAMKDVQREVWVIKENDTEVWVNAGLPHFAFQRLQGVFIEAGCVAPFSVARLEQSLFWLGQSEEGIGLVFMTRGYGVERVSTHALEYVIGQYAKAFGISDAIGFTYQQEGHKFYQLTFPAANATWVYDLTSSQEIGKPMWHQRAAFGNGAFSRHWANSFSLFLGLCVVGDYRNGNLYAYDLDTQLDNGAQRKWLRSWRALQKPSYEPVAFRSLQIDMQTGVNVVMTGPNKTVPPQVMLRWTDDGGYNYSNYIQGSAGAQGQSGFRVKFNRLGATRRQSGLDRVFELSSTDQFSVCLLGAELDV